MTREVHFTLAYLLFTADRTIMEKFCTNNLLGLRDETKQIACPCHLTLHTACPPASSVCFFTGQNILQPLQTPCSLPFRKPQGLSRDIKV
jgi:hypothetical protein